MGDFVLKKGIQVEFDKENGLFHFKNTDLSYHKKLTSRAFATIIGVNKWESVGSAILERFKLVEKGEPIDPYYSVRGDLAEMLAYDFLKNHYKVSKGIDLELATWEKDAIRYDNFPKNPKFGGMIDIAIKTPEKYRAVCEVKSKSMKDLDKIKANKGNPEEVMQGVFLSYLSKVDKCLMVYVFFTPNQEKIMREFVLRDKSIGYDIDSKMVAKDILNSTKWTFESVKIVPFKHMVSKYDMLTKTEMGYKTLSDLKKNGYLPTNYFAPNEEMYLKSLASGEEEVPF